MTITGYSGPGGAVVIPNTINGWPVTRIEDSAFNGKTNLTIGWGPTFAGRPAVLWNPLVQTSGVSFGVRTNRFGFTVTGTADIPIVIEASTRLANGSWVALQSLCLTNGVFYFSDPNWTYYPARNYRIRSPSAQSCTPNPPHQS